VILMGLLALHGLQTKCFGFGGLYGGRGYTDASNLWIADRLGAFTPPVDPFANTKGPRVASGGGYFAPGLPTPAIPNQMAAPQVGASALLNPSTGGLANLGRVMTSSQVRAPVAPAASYQPPSYSLPSDMGMSTFSPFSIPQQ
jgi:hypothetical protein